jgi:hypothetical protein
LQFKLELAFAGLTRGVFHASFGYPHFDVKCVRNTESPMANLLKVPAGELHRAVCENATAAHKLGKSLRVILRRNATQEELWNFEGMIGNTISLPNAKEIVLSAIRKKELWGCEDKDDRTLTVQPTPTFDPRKFTDSMYRVLQSIEVVV